MASSEPVQMEGIRHIGDGLLEVGEELLKEFLVEGSINDLYDVEQTPFARGKFAAVRRAVHKKTGINFAAKFLRRRRRAQSSDKDIGHEVAVLLLCNDSKHIVKLHSVHETATETALLLELATGGELQAILDDEGELSEPQAQICMREILQALRYLHSKSIAHLDIKPQNILMCGEKVEDGLKLCDFGISRVVEEGGKIREILGTADYVAPEVLQYEPLCLKTDIWSIGVLAYVLLTGCSPFAGDTKQETFLNISQCALTFPEELFEGVSPAAIEFIRSALRIKQQDRMSVEECLAHKWIAVESPERPLALESASPPASAVESEAEEKDPLTSTSSNDSMDEEEEEDEQVQPLTTCAEKETFPDVFISGPMVQEKVVEEEEMKPIQEADEDHSSLQSFCDDQSEDGGASTSDKENSLVFNTSHNNSNNISLSCSNSSHSSTEVLFPDAPTTPKVLRKAPSETPPSVKALVKKFQVDSVKQQMHNGSEASPVLSSHTPASPSLVGSTHSPQQSACFVSQIPKLVNSPKSSYVTSSRFSGSSSRAGSPAKSNLSLRTMGNPGGSSSSSRKERKSGSIGVESPGKVSLGSPLMSSNKSASVVDSPTKSSASARYSQTHMACVICGELVCRHQTTVARKPILGMEQRITC